MKKQLIKLFGVVALMSSVGYGLGSFVLNPMVSPTVSEKQNLNMETKNNTSEKGMISEKEEGSEKEKEEIVVKLGRIMVPLYKPKVITYVIADMGISVDKEENANFYKEERNREMLKSSILEQMLVISETGVFSGPTVDTDYVSYKVKENLKEEFPEIGDFLFMDLIKQDVVKS
jgi:hypothetical protein